MAPARSRRERKTESWDILNSINTAETQKSPANNKTRRRHTTHRGNVYDLPVSPQPAPAKPPRTSPRILRSGLRSQKQGPATPEPDSNNDEQSHDAPLAEYAEPDEASESREDEEIGHDDNESTVNQESEVLGSDRSSASLGPPSSERDTNGDENDAPESPSPSIPETPRPAPAAPKIALPVEFFDHFESRSDDEMPDIHEDQDQNQDQGSPEVQELVDLQLFNSQFLEHTQIETDDDRVYRHELKTCFDQEMEVIGLTNESRTIFQRSKWLRRQAKQPKPDELSASFAIVTELRHIYKEIVEIDHISINFKSELRNLTDSLFLEFVRLRHYAMWETKDEPTAYLIDQFQAYIIPRIITLILYGFKLYRNLGEPARAQLQDVLFLLVHCGLKAKDAVESGYLIKRHDSENASDWTRPIHQPLKRMLKSLNSSTASEESTIYLVKSNREEPWTRQEGSALIEGLQLYSGKVPRFQLFICR
jgi:hypothetical protein